MLATYIVPVLVVSGAATAGMIVMVAAPRPLSRLIFGVDALDAFALFLARYVGLLVFLFGCLIVYSALHPEVRVPVLVAASIEKIFFVAFVFFARLKRTPLMLAAAIADGCFALMYLMYLSGL